MPAAGLGQRPPSIISTASQDEGGFNEAMPELKAKLQPPTYEDGGGGGGGSGQERAEEQPHSLNYVDVGYRLNPDGSESREVYGSEAELYDTAKVSDMQRKFHGANGFVQDSSTVYAIIKPELQQEAVQPPLVQPARGLLQSPTSSVDGSPLHRGVYNSPPVGVVSPIRRRSSEQNGGGGGSGTGSAKSTPPMSPARTALVKGIAPIASIDAHEEEEEEEEEPEQPQLIMDDEEDEQLAVEYVEGLDVEIEEEEAEEQAPVLPERRAPAAGAALELQDLEYADTSAGEDEEDLLLHMKCSELELMDDVVDEVIKVHVTALATPAQVLPATVAAAPSPAPAVAATANGGAAPAPAPAAAMPRDDSLPDAMTAAEAERLLSSR